MRGLWVVKCQPANPLGKVGIFITQSIENKMGLWKNYDSLASKRVNERGWVRGGASRRGLVFAPFVEKHSYIAKGLEMVSGEKGVCC